MTEQTFASVWGLRYSDFEFLRRYGTKSQVMIACQLLYFRQHGHFPDERSDFDPDVIGYVTDQICAEDGRPDLRRRRGLLVKMDQHGSTPSRSSLRTDLAMNRPDRRGEM